MSCDCQVTKWLSDISDKLASSHGDIGTSKQTVEKLLNDHDKQTENAKVGLFMWRKFLVYKFYCV